MSISPRVLLRRACAPAFRVSTAHEGPIAASRGGRKTYPSTPAAISQLRPSYFLAFGTLAGYRRIIEAKHWFILGLPGQQAARPAQNLLRRPAMNLGAQPAEAVAARLKSRSRRSRVVGTAAVTVAMASMGLVGSAAANAAPGQLASAFRGFTSSELGGSTKVAIL